MHVIFTQNAMRQGLNPGSSGTGKHSEFIKNFSTLDLRFQICKVELVPLKVLVTVNGS